MTLSYEGWRGGLTVMFVLISFFIFGLFFIYKSKKTNAKLLFYVGLVAIFYGLAYLGSCVDFITILLTGNNMDNSYGLKGLLTHMWTPITIILILYIGSELLIPKKKWYIISINIVLGIVWELFIFFDPMGSFTFVYPESPGEKLIDVMLTFGSPVGILYLIFDLEIFIIWCSGFLYKSFKSTGILRKKFFLLSIGMMYTVMFALASTYIPASIIKTLIMFGIVSGLIFFYYGLREEPAEPKTKPPKKEFKVEEGLFRLTKRPATITEEEVIFHRERKICLVCKGKVGGLIFMCIECDALYCENCARTLSNLENACWVCNTPFDESKPSKPFKKDVEEVDIEVIDKTKKKQIKAKNFRENHS